MSYDFTSLSPDDFEELASDLLSREWNVHLESFKAGRDLGIDLRHSTRLGGGHGTIVQCKRYGPHRYRGLYANLKSEISKIERLQPDRYVLATSVPLSPQQKDALCTLLSPWCTAPGDVYGANELNSLIRKYPAVERSHFKLWISSTAVLQQILHARLFAAADHTIESLRLQFSKLVIHDGFNRALDILSSNHHVVIVGNPGIGKTTLAQMLLCHYLTEGFEPVTVVSNVDDAWTALHVATKNNLPVVIFYDDFLGRVGFDVEKFAKNEDSSLLQLIEKARRSSNIRFIMTTREYILSDALRMHGALSDHAEELALCTISLSDYTRTKRAHILFNHLYFSDLPNSRLEQLVQAKAYQNIVTHRHFNPRVVETVCRHANSRALNDRDFVSFVESEFDNPARIWEHPFLRDISANARLTLALLWSFKGVADLEWLRSGVLRLNGSERPEEVSLSFDEALRQLDGNFIATNRYPRYSRDGFSFVASFNNPSVEEFVGSWLASQPEFLKRLIGAVVNLDQANKLRACLLVSHLDKGQAAEIWDLLRERALLCRGRPLGKLLNVSYGGGEATLTWQVREGTLASELQVLFLVEEAAHRDDEHSEWLHEQVETEAGWRRLLDRCWYDYEIGESIRSLCEWIWSNVRWDQSLVSRALDTYLASLMALLDEEEMSTTSVSTFENLVAAAKPVLSRLDAESRARLRKAIQESASSALEDATDGDWLDSEARHLRRIGEMLDTDFSDEFDRLAEEAAHLNEDKPESRAYTPEVRRYAQETEDYIDLVSFFSGLLDRSMSDLPEG